MTRTITNATIFIALLAAAFLVFSVGSARAETPEPPRPQLDTLCSPDQDCTPEGPGVIVDLCEDLPGCPDNDPDCEQPATHPVPCDTPDDQPNCDEITHYDPDCHRDEPDCETITYYDPACHQDEPDCETITYYDAACDQDEPNCETITYYDAACDQDEPDCKTISYYDPACDQDEPDCETITHYDPACDQDEPDCDDPAYDGPECETDDDPQCEAGDVTCEPQVEETPTPDPTPEPTPFATPAPPDSGSGMAALTAGPSMTALLIAALMIGSGIFVGGAALAGKRR